MLSPTVSVVKIFSKTCVYINLEFYQPPHPAVKFTCKSKDMLTFLLSALGIHHLRHVMDGDAFMGKKVRLLSATVGMTHTTNAELESNGGM